MGHGIAPLCQSPRGTCNEINLDWWVCVGHNPLEEAKWGDSAIMLRRSTPLATVSPRRWRLLGTMAWSRCSA